MNDKDPERMAREKEHAYYSGDASYIDGFKDGYRAASPEIMEALRIATEALELMAKPDKCSVAPNEKWLYSWRNTAKQAAQAALAKIKNA